MDEPQCWSNEQDVLLCRAYFNTTQDTTIDQDETSDAFWQLIHTTWTRLCGTWNLAIDCRSNAGSSMKRMQLINSELASFIRAYRTVLRCTGEKQPIKADELALKVYTLRNNGKEFQFMHCWQIFKESSPVMKHIALLHAASLSDHDRPREGVPVVTDVEALSAMKKPPKLDLCIRRGPNRTRATAARDRAKFMQQKDAIKYVTDRNLRCVNFRVYVLEEDRFKSSPIRDIRKAQQLAFLAAQEKEQGPDFL